MNARGHYGYRNSFAMIAADPSVPVVNPSEPSWIVKYPTMTNLLLSMAVSSVGGVMIAKAGAEDPKKAVGAGIVGGIILASFLNAFLTSPKSTLPL